MKSLRKAALVILIFFTCSYTYAQYCDGIRFTEMPVFTEAEIDSAMGIVYGNASSWLGITEHLGSNIFFPKLSLDSLTRRPFILLLHGGSFLTGTRNELNFDCKEFARRGYVAATIDYRVGWDYLPDCGGDTVSSAMAIYRAMQDCHAALRYFVANASSFRIDTAWIFIGGNSAGAYATVDLAFVNQDEINGRFPWCQPALGNLNTSGNSLSNIFTLKGLFHNWGSIIDINFLHSEDAIPMVAFAGALDSISHIDSGYYQNCSNYALDWGTRAIYKRLVSFGECADLTVKEDGGHGVYNSTASQNLFRIGRASCFFKSLFCNDCTSFYSTDSIPAACSSNYRTTSVSEHAGGYSFSVSPNPAISTITITVEYDFSDSPLTIFDSYGRAILKSRLNGLTATLDISNFPDGAYFIRLDQGGKGKMIFKYH